MSGTRMPIVEAQAELVHLQANILNDVKRHVDGFEAATGLMPTAIEVQFVTHFDVDVAGPPTREIVGVKVFVEL